MLYQKHTLRLRAGDFDALSELLLDKGISPSEAIRRVVSAYVDKLRENSTDAFADAILNELNEKA